MGKTKIEWCTHSVNPVKGLCPMACPYCYARRMYKRFKWNPELRLDADVFLPLLNTIRRKPARIFVGSTMELFHPAVKQEWRDFIFERVALLPEHAFIFLTKCPQNLPQEWPDNCWVGVTATNDVDFVERSYVLRFVKAPVKFISFEPLLGWAYRSWIKGGWYNLSNMLQKDGIGWVIMGQCTPVKKSTTPRLEWLAEIADAADQADVKVFLKNNLSSCAMADYPELLDANGSLRQEIPELAGKK